MNAAGVVFVSIFIACVIVLALAFLPGCGIVAPPNHNGFYPQYSGMRYK